VCANLGSDFELCADAVCATDQEWILVACGFYIKETTKAADLAISTWTTGRTGKRFDSLDEGITCVDRDACLSISEGWRGRECTGKLRMRGR